VARALTAIALTRFCPGAFAVLSLKAAAASHVHQGIRYLEEQKAKEENGAEGENK
jgi:hypothetical protein